MAQRSPLVQAPHTLAPLSPNTRTHPTMSTTTAHPSPDLLSRPCDDCGQVYFYESIKLGSAELGHTVQPRCSSCHELAEIAEARRIERDRRHRIQRDIEANLAIDIIETDPNHPGFNQALWGVVSRWRPSPESFWLFVHGPADRCKTRALALLYKKIMWSGIRALWTTAGALQLAAKERNRYGPEAVAAKELVRSWMRVPYLFIDDLGKNDWPRELESLFFQLLDHRKTSRLPCLFSSNAPPETLGLLISDLNRDPIVGRLRDRCTLLDLGR